MEKLSHAIDRFCIKHRNLGIPGLMRYIVFANAFVFLMDMFSGSAFSSWLTFNSYRIFQEGQIWRLLTFILVPERSFSSPLSILWFMVSCMCYYFLGSALEQRWGTTRFTVFYGLGIILNLFCGLILSVLYPYTATISMYYVNLTLFFSIATLYPNLEFRLYFIIPVKAKWLAWLSGGMLALDVILRLVSGQFALAFLPIVAVFNYFIFTWDDLSFMIAKGKHRAKYASNRSPQKQAIDLQQAQKKLQQQKGYLHKCTVCGVTDQDNPSMDFRYCSKCEGYHCYCMDHINNHDHKE